jgi:hypothetical protein
LSYRRWKKTAGINRKRRRQAQSAQSKKKYAKRLQKAHFQELNSFVSQVKGFLKRQRGYLITLKALPLSVFLKLEKLKDDFRHF